METIILICLLIVIVLLLHEKFQSKSKSNQNQQMEESPENVYDLMGKSKPIERNSKPKERRESQSQEQADSKPNFEKEIGREDFKNQNLQEESEAFLEEVSDWEMEQESRYLESDFNNGSAAGVTFEELSTVNLLLQHEVPEANEKEKLVQVISKLEGTELFDLLQESIGGISEKISRLMDSVNSKVKSGSSTMQKEDLDDFNIEEFV